MTIAVALKVRDGIVLAADSATTLTRIDPPDENGGQAEEARFHNIYNHANKVVNLRKGEPIGFMTWGTGGFGSANIETLAKDFRAEEWEKHFADGYRVKDVAARVSEFLQTHAADETGPFGFMVAGHSPGQALGEAWVVELNDGTWHDPTEALSGEQGIAWYGQPAWLQRLILGFDPDGLAAALVEKLDVAEDEVIDRLSEIVEYTAVSFINPAMPIQDAINLGFFLVEVTKGAIEFSPGHLTVGGPTEVAAITKHEGFKWVARKHYFDSVRNPVTPRMERS